MVDNYVGTQWKLDLTGHIYTVVWQQDIPEGMPSVPGNTMVVLAATPHRYGYAAWPGQSLITLPVDLLDDKYRLFIRVRLATTDHPDQEPQSPGHFEANT